MHDYLDHYVTTDSPNFTLASCQLQNLTRQRCLCQIWAVWRSSEHASSSPNKCQLALSDIRVFRGVKKSASDSFSISEVVLRFAEYFLWIIDLDFTFLEEFWGLHICSHNQAGVLLVLLQLNPPSGWRCSYQCRPGLRWWRRWHTQAYQLLQADQ